MEISLYVHWPFCLAKCPYCDFNSHVRDEIEQEKYKAALISELDYVAEKAGPRKLKSIFFGGGTPSLMKPESVFAIIQKAGEVFKVEDNIEITLEANPTSVEAYKFKAFQASGVNRVSIGVQSFVAKNLEFLGRKHSAKEAMKAVELAAEIFPRYSFDLIYALPNQTPDEWREQLKNSLKLSGDHISLYQLTIEENTAFYHDYHVKKSFALPPDDGAAMMYKITQEIMEAAAMPAYEVSNHAVTGMESRHNLSYWNYDEYVGIGPGAHGRLHLGAEIIATSAIKGPELWLKSVAENGHGFEVWNALDKETIRQERLMMRMRILKPVEYTLCGKDKHHAKMAMLEANGLVVLGENDFTITQSGRLVLSSLIGVVAF